MRGLCAILLVLWAGTAIAQTSDDDRDFITGLIENTISNDDMVVRLDNFQGALSSEATADAITIADADGIWLRLDGIIIDWNRSALLSRRVEIEKLSAERIELIRLPISNETSSLPNAQATPFSLPELPVSIEIADVSATEIIITEALLGEPITAQFAGAISLIDGTADTQILLERTDEKTGRFDVDASFDDATRQLALFLLAEEGQNGIAARLLDLPDRPSLKLEVTGDAPLDDFAGNIALATDGADRVTGTVRLSQPIGTVDRAFALDLKGDVRPLLASEYETFFGGNTVLKVEGTAFGIGGFRLSNLIVAADQLVLRGSAAFDAQGWPEMIDLRGRLASGSTNRVLLPIGGVPTEVSGMSLNVKYDAADGDAWTGAFDVTSLGRDGVSIDALAVSGGGEIYPGAGAARGRFSADLNYAARGLALEDEALSEAIGTDIEGTLSMARLENEPFVIRDLTLTGAGLMAQGQAFLKGPDDRFWTRAQLSVQADDFSRFAAISGLDLSGAGTVSLSGDVQPFDGIFDLDLEATTKNLALGIAQLDPMLTGESILSLSVDRDTDGTRLRNVDLRGQEVSAQGRGEITGQTASAAFTAQINDLNIVTPSLSGPATLQADVSTDPEGKITLDANADAPRANAAFEGIATPLAGGYTVRGEGDVAVQDLSAYGDLIGQRLGGGLNVALDGTFTTTTGVLAADVVARTQDLRAGSDVLDRVLAGLGRVSVSVGLSQAGRLRLDAIDMVFPNLTATGAVATSGSDTTANLSVRLRDVALLVSDFSGPLVADVVARQDAAGWQVSGDATGPARTSARASGRVSNAGQLDLSVSGSAPLALANLYIAPRQVNGLADFNLSVQGPAALSSVRGPITIRDARLAAPTLQQAVEDIAGTVTLTNGAAQLDLRGSNADGGNLTLTGPINLAAPYRAEIRLALANFILRDPTLYRTTANGRIDVIGPLTGGANITGTIDLDATEVQVPSTGVSALGSLPAVTHLGVPTRVSETLARAEIGVTAKPATATSSGVDFPINLLIRAPSRIFVRGRGLDAELGGQLRLTGSTNAIVPIGRFDLVRGRLSILGQQFDLDEGYAQLQGDFTPFLRLVATTEASTGTTISIIVEGPADEIDVRFESSPEMPQDEVLAQLLFGRDLSEISPLQAVQLASAVATLAGAGGGGGVLNNLREGLDLDQLDLVTDEDGNAAVRAGKYISESVYTDVTVGTDGNTEINLNIDIDRNFTARGSVASDGETSVGIFFERDY